MRKILFHILLLSSLGAWGQVPERPDIDLELFAENLFQVQSVDISYEDLYESLLMHYTNPINLNHAEWDELASLFILSPQQLSSYFEYIETNGALLSIFELQAVPEFDMQTIRLLLPFVTVRENMLDNRPLWKRITTESNNYLLLRHSSILEKQKGYSGDHANPYLGNQQKLYGRFRVNHTRDFSLGFTFEKDAGEQLKWNKNQRGADFYSYHLYLQNKGIIKTLAIGDFQLQYGQGLVFGAGFNPGKGAESVLTVKRSSLGLRPYTSVLESGFFRGAGVTIQQGNFYYSGFYSRLNQDGNINQDTVFTDYEEFISSIQATGLHRTQNEIGNKNTILEQGVGGNVTYRHKSLEIGSNFLLSQFSTPIFKKPNNYNLYEFRGFQNHIGSINVNYNWQNFLLFSEVARSKSGGIGAVGGFASSLSKTIDFSMILRNYARDFHSFYGNSFGEGSRNINEKGIYWGLKIKPSKKYFLSAYYDRFKFPWLKFGTEAPSAGHEFLIRLNYVPKRSIILYVQVRQEVKQITAAQDGVNLNRLVSGRKTNYTVNMDYAVSKILKLKSRVQWSSYQQNVMTSGFAVIQDLNLNFKQFRISTRLALFDTEDYENRQYTYERDVLYAFSIPAYSGNGVRTYFLMQYKPTRKLTIQAKYAKFKYIDRNEIGSGNELITGNKKADLKLQVRIRF